MGELYKEKLENGLEIIGMEPEDIGIAYIELMVESGGIYYKPAGVPRGTPHMLEHVLANPEERDFMFMINGGTGIKNVKFIPVGYLLKEEVVDYLNWLADIFDKEIKEDVVNYERGRVIEERRLAREDEKSRKVLDFIFGEIEFNDRMLNLGDIDEIKSITVEDLEKFRELYFGSNRAKLIILGDYDRDLLEEIMSGIRKAKREEIIPYPKPIIKSGRYSISDSEQNSIHFFWHLSDEENNAELSIVSDILKKRLVDQSMLYYTNVSINRIYDDYFLRIDAYTENIDFFERTLEELLREIAEGEVNKDIERIKRELLLEKRIKNIEKMRYEIEKLNWFREGKNYDKFLEGVEKTKKEDIQKKAEELIDKDKIIVEIIKEK